MQAEYVVEEMLPAQHSQALIQAGSYYIAQVAQWCSGAVVEAGHFYTDRQLDGNEILSAKIGQTICATLSQLGIGPVVPMLFIDNLNVEAGLGDHTTANTTQLEQAGFHPEAIIYEVDMVVRANEILDILINNGQPESSSSPGVIHRKKHRYLKPTEQGIYLKEPYALIQDSEGNPKCPLLDAVAYIQKFEQYKAICVTVLPNNAFYPKQQHTTKAILKAAGYDIPILNVYFDPNGNLTFEYDF